MHSAALSFSNETLSRVLVGMSAAVLLLVSPFLVIGAAASDSDIHAVIEAKLRAQGADKEITAHDFAALVDALSKAASQKGVTIASVAAGDAAVQQTFAKQAADAASAQKDVSSYVPLGALSSTEQAGIGVIALTALLLVWRMYRRYKQLRAAEASIHEQDPPNFLRL